ncbi:MAG: phage-shock protein [Novosphingobium lindaniclasticum]|uniref:PspC domain-containing protein n=1 Tax=Novosphingobium lindaniclasticum TaxID=1329895 RepID=UPI002408F4F0|nr:PspC domain-containing protein [Novosphingobium lindaniclasticum]MDF2637362.1 phage-shock protein [Novosphingobium lindaniclasticum]
MSRGQFYLDKSNAKLAGVCSGIADYTGVDTLWVRIAAVLLTFFVSFVTIPIYIAVALMADKRPMSLYSEAEEERLLRRMERRRNRQGYGLMRPTVNRESPNRSGRLRGELSDIDRRVAEMEAHYTSSNSRLAAEIDSLR